VEQSAEQETMFSPQAALQFPSPQTQPAPQSLGQLAEFSPQEATHWPSPHWQVTQSLGQVCVVSPHCGSQNRLPH
jgi:hypothetical protein